MPTQYIVRYGVTRTLGEFSAGDVKRLWFIKRAQSLGFSLAEIALIIRHARQRKSPCPMVREIIQRHVEQTGEELEELILDICKDVLEGGS